MNGVIVHGCAGHAARWLCHGVLLEQDMVEEMSRRYRECFGEVFRFQIMNGTLWVDHISERHQGWYPSKLGAGDPRLFSMQTG